jgi:hypothetical protein
MRQHRILALALVSPTVCAVGHRRPGGQARAGTRTQVSGVDHGRWPSDLRRTALLLARCLPARSDGVLHIAGALGLTARHLRRRAHDSAIYCATFAAKMQMPVLRVGLSLMYVTDRRRESRILDGMAKPRRRPAQRARQAARADQTHHDAMEAPTSAQQPMQRSSAEILERIKRVRVERDSAEAKLDALVDRAVELGIGWPGIATQLGVTRQAARQRYQRRRA